MGVEAEEDHGGVSGVLEGVGDAWGNEEPVDLSGGDEDVADLCPVDEAGQGWAQDDGDFVTLGVDVIASDAAGGGERQVDVGLGR